MKAHRLLRLADFLEHANLRGKFNLDEWKYKTDCGTTACAIGWACSLPDFRKDGLKLKKALVNEPGYLTKRHREDYFPVFDGKEGHDAIMAFFDIPTSVMNSLFFRSGYPKGHTSRKDVARKIRAFVASEAENNTSVKMNHPLY